MKAEEEETGKDLSSVGSKLEVVELLELLDKLLTVPVVLIERVIIRKSR